MPQNNVVAFHLRVVSPKEFHDGNFLLDGAFEPEWEIHMKSCEKCRMALVRLLAETSVKMDKMLKSAIVTPGNLIQ